MKKAYKPFPLTLLLLLTLGYQGCKAQSTAEKKISVQTKNQKTEIKFKDTVVEVGMHEVFNLSPDSSKVVVTNYSDRVKGQKITVYDNNGNKSLELIERNNCNLKVSNQGDLALVFKIGGIDGGGGLGARHFLQLIKSNGERIFKDSLYLGLASDFDFTNEGKSAYIHVLEGEKSNDAELVILDDKFRVYKTFVIKDINGFETFRVQLFNRKRNLFQVYVRKEIEGKNKNFLFLIDTDGNEIEKRGGWK